MATDFRRVRRDAGLSVRAAATAARIDASALSRFERGQLMLRLDNLVALGIVVGAPLQVAFRAASGPQIRDRLQAARVEALLALIDPAWRRWVEVPVGRAALGGGVIDVVLAHPTEPLLVAVESEGEIRRLEQVIRWSAQKADALAHAQLASELRKRGSLRVERILVIASTRHNREVVETHSETFRAAYPATLERTVRSLRDASAPFAGSALLWLSAGRATPALLTRPPNAITVGR